MVPYWYCFISRSKLYDCKRHKHTSLKMTEDNLGLNIMICWLIKTMALVI